MERVEQLLDYMHTNPNTFVHYHASDMILNVHSNVLYLPAGRGRSRAGNCVFLGSLRKEGAPIKLNGNIDITCATLKLVAASATEANIQEA